MKIIDKLPSSLKDKLLLFNTDYAISTVSRPYVYNYAFTDIAVGCRVFADLLQYVHSEKFLNSIGVDDDLPYISAHHRETSFYISVTSDYITSVNRFIQSHECAEKITNVWN